MKRICLIVLVLLSQQIYAQDEAAVTNAFTITGKVKNEKTITLTDLLKYKVVELKDANTSCSPKKEDKAKWVKAVLLKDILDSVAFEYERPRMLNQYYFLFIASDGYKVLFSFNEIYNTEIGRNLYVVTEMDGNGKKENSIQILSTKDIKAGSRNMKWLSKIVVGSVE